MAGVAQALVLLGGFACWVVCQQVWLRHVLLRHIYDARDEGHMS